MSVKACWQLCLSVCDWSRPTEFYGAKVYVRPGSLEIHSAKNDKTWLCILCYKIWQSWKVFILDFWHAPLAFVTRWVLTQRKISELPSMKLQNYNSFKTIIDRYHVNLSKVTLLYLTAPVIALLCTISNLIIGQSGDRDRLKAQTSDDCGQYSLEKTCKQLL